MLILSVFKNKKSDKYFPRKTHFKLPFLNDPASGGGGEGGSVLVVEAFSSSGRGHIGPYPFFSLSAWLTVADKPQAGG
jgi:hypothetical protein